MMVLDFLIASLFQPFTFYMVKNNSRVLNIAFVHKETFCEVKGPCICDRIPDTTFFMFTNITPHFDDF